MASALRSVAVLAVASALAALSAPGCSQQGEGERCEVTTDCDSGLTCVAKGDLLEDITPLCCPAEGAETSERCTRKGVTSSGGSGGSAGTAGSAGTSVGGAAAGATGEDGGTSGSTGVAGEPSVAGGAPTGDAGAAGGGVPSTAGAPAGGAGQGGVD